MSQGTFLIFGKERIDIGVPVVTYEDSGGFSFYYPPRGRPHYREVNPLFEGVAGSRKEKVDKVVLHHDGTRDSAGCFRVLVERALSTHLMIDADGTVYQPLNLRDIAYHAANVNEESIGIDLNNPVRPEREPGPTQRTPLYRGEINGGLTVSLGYTDAQYESLIAVLNGLVRAFPKLRPLAPIGADGRVLKRKLVDLGFAGIVGHLHVSASKWDPGPGFDWERVLIGVRGNRLFFPVTLPGTRNLAHVPKSRALKEAEAYFRNTESGAGGYFPVGLNQAWHTGVHLHVEPGTPVLAPADGRIKVARQMDPVEMGSPNMVLIEHEHEIAGAKRKFWSVISHLRKEKLALDSEVPWIRRLYLKPDQLEALTESDGERLPSSPGRTGLTAGRAALLDEPVKAGEIIGYSDRFTPDPEGGAPEPLIDVAIISDKPLVTPKDPTFTIVEDDVDPDVLCNSGSIWKHFTTRPEVLRGLVQGGYPLSPAELRDFFGYEEAARQLRWVIVKHVTEWSEATDFAGLFGGGIDFEWSARKAARRYMARVAPFLWWDEGVTKHVGLPKDRLVFAHHPIAILAVLAMGEARRALQPGDEGPEKGLEGEALRKARKKDAEYDREYGYDTGCSIASTQGLVGVEELEGPADDDLEREGWMRWEQGEWEPKLD